MSEINVEQVQQAEQAAAWSLSWKARLASNSQTRPPARDLYPSVKKGDYFGLRVRGASMSPLLENGDTIVVCKGDSIASGDVAIVCVAGRETTVKQVNFLADGGIVLVPRNTNFEPIFISNEKIKSLQLTFVGKVVEIQRRL